MPQRHHEPAVPKPGAIKRAWQRLPRARRLVTRRLLKDAKALMPRPRRSLRMRAEDRRLPVDYYLDDIRKLETLVDRDLSGWLK